MQAAHTPRKAINKAYLKEKVSRQDFDLFRANLRTLFERINEEESEENAKGHLRDFLRDTWYKDQHLIATKGRADLVIHVEKTTKSNVGVLFETKLPGNTAQMVTQHNLNRKALQQLITYYLEERIEHDNYEVKNLVITNVYEWFIFDEHQFDKLFHRSKPLLKFYEHFKQVGKDKPYFYEHLAKNVIPEVENELHYTYFDLRRYRKLLDSNREADERKLLALYKVLSPPHLLKLPFANDSNSLDRKFYAELLHLIGLEEVKEKSKKVIQRKPTGERQHGSLLENTIIQLQASDSLRKVPNRKRFGESPDEQLFNIALELCITWMNRILFLKLLEAQLLDYHAGAPQYRFLNAKTIPDFDDLNELFFQVLAKKVPDRPDYLSEHYQHIPYLNSSLFDYTELEASTIFISNLKDTFEIRPLSTTVLKNEQGKRRTTPMRPLHYLFDFLEAYDFDSEGSDTIQEENKTLINAAVLGLIFEKINGYKDGSYFTPGFITMYMCRETLRRAVVQKFNEAHQLDCADFEELKSWMGKPYKKADILAYNQCINSLKICDPAVGSGHFLVSALNELLAIKSELGILADIEGSRLSDVLVTVENDELIVLHHPYSEEEQLFEYRLHQGKVDPEVQRTQQTLFHEKQQLIENCLFGVDINPNSVKICRLRLWIELLKHAYYRSDLTGSRNLSGLAELETLPNIDINIKQGNSLISRFALDAGLSGALRKVDRNFKVSDYKDLVQRYQHATDRDEKRQLLQLIDDIKNAFQVAITRSNPKVRELQKLANEYNDKYQSQQLFELNLTKAQEKDKAELQAKIDKLQTEIEDLRNAAIYDEAFEWRFEFPEVLDEDGKFTGFDVVIGNPPYLRVRNDKQVRNYYEQNYDSIENQFDLYHIFIERAKHIVQNTGEISFIVPNAFLANESNKKLRQFILENYGINYIIDIKDDVFEDASVDVLIFSFTLQDKQISDYLEVSDGKFVLQHSFVADSFRKNQNFNFTVTLNQTAQQILRTIEAQSGYVKDFFDTTTGIKEYQTGKGNPPQTKQHKIDRVFNSTKKVDETYLPEIRGKNIIRYGIKWENEYIKYGEWLAEPRNPEFFIGKKILNRKIPGIT